MAFPEKYYFKNSSFWHFNSRFVFKTRDVVERGTNEIGHVREICISTKAVFLRRVFKSKYCSFQEGLGLCIHGIVLQLRFSKKATKIDLTSYKYLVQIKWEISSIFLLLRKPEL